MKRVGRSSGLVVQLLTEQVGSFHSVGQLPEQHGCGSELESDVLQAQLGASQAELSVPLAGRRWAGERWLLYQLPYAEHQQQLG